MYGNLMPSLSSSRSSSRRLFSRYVIIMLVTSATLAFSAIVLIPYLVTNAERVQDNERRILTVNSIYDINSSREVTKIDYLRVGEMKPNSAVLFLNPFGRSVAEASSSNNNNNIQLKPGIVLTDQQRRDVLRNTDPFEVYTIIRLPEWFGGYKNDISAYRAYSAVSISDQCLSRYWETEGRWRIENPCAGDMYRPWDGIATQGPAAVGISGRGIITAGYFNALASVDLSVDKDGYIVAKIPNKDSYYPANGEAGEGRRFTPDMMEKSNTAMISAASNYSGYMLPFTLSLLLISSNYYWLSEIEPGSDPSTFNSNNNASTTSSSSVSLIAIYRPTATIALQKSHYYPTTVLIQSFSIKDFPDYTLEKVVGLSNNAITTNGENVSNDDGNNNAKDDKSVINYNNTNTLKNNQTAIINSLLSLYPYYSNNDNTTKTITKEGKGIVVSYAIFKIAEEIKSKTSAADTNNNNVVPVDSGALIWTKSKDGTKDILIIIRAKSIGMDDLISLAKSLNI